MRINIAFLISTRALLYCAHRVINPPILNLLGCDGLYSELGGNPDEDDPYDLRISMELFAARAAQGRQMATMDVFGTTTNPISAVSSSGTTPTSSGAEWAAERKQAAAEAFSEMDTNEDGVVDDAELEAFLDLLEEEVEAQDKAAEVAGGPRETLHRHEHTGRWQHN